jgi:alpha-ketoglutarate-dependent taurine dioxygenase
MLAIREESFDHGGSLPWVVRPLGASDGDRLVDWIAGHRPQLDERLATIGAVLFRGFNLDGAADLERVMHAYDSRPTLPYVGGDTPRTRVGGDVYTSTECPPSVWIPLHNELSYLSRYPRRLFFLCAQPPARGGETTLADGAAVFAALDPAVRDRFVERGVRYIAIYPGRSAVAAPLRRLKLLPKTWMEVFETDERAVAEARCRDLQIDYRWLASGALYTSTVRPAVIMGADGSGGEPRWFNQAHLFRMSPRWMGRFHYTMAALVYFRREGRGRDAQYGDGGEIEPEALDHVHSVLRRHTVAPRWQRGDLLMIDNLRCMHGRNPFNGPRRVLVAMTG